MHYTISYASHATLTVQPVTNAMKEPSFFMDALLPSFFVTIIVIAIYLIFTGMAWRKALKKLNIGLIAGVFLGCFFGRMLGMAVEALLR